jgi:phosphoribosyl-ATP pyrophosphohydrolase
MSVANEFEALYETVLERKNSPEEGSYTCYLYDKGLEKILKKVGEESTEVIIAALSQTSEDLVNELGDLFYHLMVLMVQKGVTIQDVEAELEKRSAKKHNLKAERKPIENY